MKTKICFFLIGFSFSLGVFAQNYNTMLFQEWVNNAWKNSMRMTYTYDNKGNVSQVAGDTWTSTNTWVKSTLTTYNYSNNLLDNTLLQMWENGSWEDLHKTFYTYEGPKNIKTITTQMFFASSWMVFSRTTNTYSSNQLVSELTEAFDFLTMQLKNSSKTTYEYNSDGTELRNTSQMWNSTSGSWENSHRTTYAYDNQKNLTSTTSEDFLTGAWVNESRSLVTYDKSANITNGTSKIKEILYQKWIVAETKWTDESKDLFSYNASDLMSQILSQIWKVNAWENESLTTLTYNSQVFQPLPPEVTDLSVYPNPFTGLINIEGYHPEGSQIFVFSTDGKMIKTFKPEGSNSQLNLSDLQKGSYLIRVVSPGSEKVVKLIKAE